MFRDWESFYIIVGPTAGALIGIMFVVATLTAGMDATRRKRGAQIYISPIVFHFAVIVIVSAITAVPDIPPVATGVMLALCAGAGLLYAATTAIRVFTVRIDTTGPIDRSDKFFYGILPPLVYAAFAAAVATIWVAPPHAPYAIGAVMVALLFLGVRNAWDLATFLVHPPDSAS
jgi:hypothetical protein